MPDIAIRVTSALTASERRVTPEWSVARFKARLEPVTGIPPAAQRLTIRRRRRRQPQQPRPNDDDNHGDGGEDGGQDGGEDGAYDEEVLEADDEERTPLSAWRLVKGMEIYVHDTRPKEAQPNFLLPTASTSTSASITAARSSSSSDVPGGGGARGARDTAKKKLARDGAQAGDEAENEKEKEDDEGDEEGNEEGEAVPPKFVLPAAAYEARADSVLAWKRRQQLGRFDPAAPQRLAAAAAAHERAARAKGAEVGRRVRVGGEDTRRGTIRYVGPVPEIPGGAAADGWWVGVELDEPAGGKNDGSIGGTRYFRIEGGGGRSSGGGEGGGGGGQEGGGKGVDGGGEGEEEGGASLKRGIFVRPERIEVGDFPPLADLEELEEI